MVYFTADLHLGHQNIIKYCDRPFDTADDMNTALIDNWNKKVSSDDKVFVLGDFALGSSKDIIKWGRALKGNKTLILGNHDRATKSVYLDAGFSEVIKYPILWSNFYILSHAPKFIPDMGPYFNIYGHVHNDIKYADVTTNSCCISVERTDYTPISFVNLRERVENTWEISKKCKEV